MECSALLDIDAAAAAPAICAHSTLGLGGSLRSSCEVADLGFGDGPVDPDEPEEPESPDGPLEDPDPDNEPPEPDERRPGRLMG